MENIKFIVEKFGGQQKLASLLGVAQSTVAYWVKLGRCPTKWDAKITATLASLGLSQESNDVQFLFYRTSNGETADIKVWVKNQSVWASMQAIAKLFDTHLSNISKHISNIFNDLELDKDSVVEFLETTAADGKRYKVAYYNLDVILSVGYRVNSKKAIDFRKWATKILKDFLIKGFVLNEDRLKQGSSLFGEDFFDELLEKIREIRASERRFYQKVTDLYSQCSIDYDKNAEITRQFFATVQDKLHYAVHGHTASELIALRANASKPNMGLTSWKDRDKIRQRDALIAKNYLQENEIKELERLVSMFLDYAENLTRKHQVLTMSDWVERLNAFLEFNGYNILQSHGKLQKKRSTEIVIKEFLAFDKKQKENYKSDYDRFVEMTKKM